MPSIVGAADVEPVVLPPQAAEDAHGVQVRPGQEVVSECRFEAARPLGVAGKQAGERVAGATPVRDVTEERVIRSHWQPPEEQ